MVEIVTMEGSDKSGRGTRAAILVAALASVLVLAVSTALAVVASSGLPFDLAGSQPNSTEVTSPGSYVNVTNPTNPSQPAQVANYTGPYRSGPTSTYPGVWTCGCGCRGIPEYVTTRLNLNLNISEELNHIDLDRVYAAVTADPTFVRLSTGHGWVVSSWIAAETGGTDVYLHGEVIGDFVLTTNNAPDGYVSTYYNLHDGSVEVLYQQYLVFMCPVVVAP